MKATTRRTISMARRALDFALAHPLDDTGYTALVTRLQGEITKADGLGRLQVEGSLREHTAVERRTALRNAIRSRQLKRLASLTQLNVTDHPELAGKYDLPQVNGPNRAFLLRAQSILQAATDQKDLLAQLGLGDSFLADLTSAVTAFDVATQDSHSARADHVGARGEFSALARRCDQEVTLIGTYIESVYATDAQTLTAWRSARNLAGPFTRSKPAPVPGPVPVPDPAPVPVSGDGPVSPSAQAA
ncbi:MAG TPA: hypothetical protein VGM77_06275 [Gemmatimonadales bacterium]|jgi:hypothetical protein